MDTRFVVIFLTGFCLLLFLLQFARQKRTGFDDPILMLFIMFCYSVIFKIVYVFGFRPDDIKEALTINYDRVLLGESRDIFVNGMLYITLCLTAFFAGYQISSAHLRKFLVLPDIQVSYGAAQFICFALVIFSVACIVIFLNLPEIADKGAIFQKKFNDIPGGATQRFFHSSYWWFKAATLVKCAFYVLLILWINKGETGSRLFYALLIGSFLATLAVYNLAGNRATAILILIELAIVWSVKPTLRSAILYAIFGSLLAGTIFFSTQYRYAGHLPPSKKLIAKIEREALKKLPPVAVKEVNEVPEIMPADQQPSVSGSREVIDKPTPEASDAPVNEAIKPVEPDKKSSMSERRILAKKVAARKISSSKELRAAEAYAQGRYAFDVVKISQIVERVPERMPYLKGESFIGWLFVVVPSSVWPDKPRYASLPSVISDKIFQQPANNVPPSIIGESYLNFGWFGALLLLGVGAVTRLVYDFVKSNRTSGIALVLGAIVLSRITIMLFSTSFGTTVLKISLDIIPVLAILGTAWWFARRQPASSK